MGKAATVRSNRRLLLNAEPFGFGPTAAIADCFPQLRAAFSTVGFVGAGHTLDLQRSLPYDAVHDISGLSGAQEHSALENIFAGYDVMLTALDFTMAEKALACGLQVNVYDPLTWYWKSIPAVLSRGVRYLAQDFFGVRERLVRESACFSSPHVVAPIIAPVGSPCTERNKILLNLGGLNNPFWTAQDTLAYARLIVESFCRGVNPGTELIVIASNAAIARALAEFGACNYTRTEMQEILGQAKYALMTPGLGNIYDAARFGTPTIWLPPANDSQGQQLQLLAANGLVDGSVDWHQICGGATIDYSGDQSGILCSIAQQVTQASADKGAQRSLGEQLAAQRRAIVPDAPGLCAGLITRFGSGGADQVAQIVSQS
jgi:hypothetical protein